MSDKKLVIVPCGSAKVWDRYPDAGPVMAKDAYVGSPFKVNRKYAEAIGDRWVILSAKYGFIKPDFTIREPYEVTFNRKNSGPITDEALKKQMRAMRLSQYSEVIGLGGAEYRKRIERVFEDTAVNLNFPFAGLAIGKAMQAMNQEIKTHQTAGSRSG